jgi:hypothetical protein
MAPSCGDAQDPSIKLSTEGYQSSGTGLRESLYYHLRIMFRTPDLTDRVNLRLLLLKPLVYGNLETSSRFVV